MKYDYTTFIKAQISQQPMMSQNNPKSAAGWKISSSGDLIEDDE